MAPKIIGGKDAPSFVSGMGIESLSDATNLHIIILILFEFLRYTCYNIIKFLGNPCFKALGQCFETVINAYDKFTFLFSFRVNVE